MRLRFVHTLSLWLLLAVGVCVAAMGGVMAWNLGQGFSAYLQARDLERLDSFVKLVEERLQAAGDVSALYQRRLDLGALLHEMARREGALPPPDRRPEDADDPAEAGLLPPLPDETPPQALPGTRGQPGPEGPPGAPGPADMPGRAGPPGQAVPGDAFGARVALFYPTGQPLMGRPLAADRQPLLEAPVRLGGQVVALARLRPIERLPDAHEVGFLRQQYLGIGAVAGSMFLLSLLAAGWLARHWARPLAAVQQATERIAQGELGVRLPESRHDEIGDLMRNVNQMAAGLQRMEGARRRWMADMSHELRTPLAGLHGEIEALVDGIRPLTPQAVLSLREDVLRLGALVDDLHLLAMADLQALPCRLAEADAVAVLQQALQRFDTRAQAAGLQLGWASPPPDHLPVLWDSTRIGQLLGNLLANSLRYTDAPGRILLGLQAQGEEVLVTVDDTAPGVAADDLPRLFEPLYRADAARGRHSGGSGLGLAICEAIASAHGGRLQAQASPLGGLQVLLRLPRQAKPPKA